MFPALLNALVQGRVAARRGTMAGRDLAVRDADAAIERDRQAAADRRATQRFDYEMGADERVRARTRAERASQREVASRILGAESAQLDGLADDADVSPIVESIVKRREAERAFEQQRQLQDRADARAERAAARADARAERSAERAAQRANASAGQRDFKDTMQLRGAYEGNQQVKDASEVAAAARNAVRAANLRSGQGDNSLVYAVAKILDPGSVVREGEFATIARSASIPEQLRGQMLRAARGERLTDAMRAELVKVVQERAAAAREGLQPVMARYGGLARTGGIDSASVVFDPLEDVPTAGASGPFGPPRASRDATAPRTATGPRPGSAIVDSLFQPTGAMPRPRRATSLLDANPY